jgi:predicted permease
MVIARLAGLFAGGRGDRRIDDEIEAHLEMLAADFEAHGMSAQEARLAARREFGGVAQTREEWRRVRGLPWFETLMQDAAYAFRQWRRAPGFAVAAILTLGLGIGANTAIYQVLDAVVYRPLPVKDPSQLVELGLSQAGRPMSFSYPLFRELAARQTALDGLFAVSAFPLRQATWRGPDGLRQIRGVLVTGDYFRVLGVTPHRGRAFTMDDDRASAPVAVISDRFWESGFDRSSSAVGQSLDINQVAVTIVGVAPEGFFGETLGESPDVWLPMSLQPRLTPDDYLNAPFYNWLAVMGRMRPGVSAQRAQAQLEALYRSAADPGLRRVAVSVHLELHPASRGIDELRRFAEPLYVLMAIVGLVLLIASSNLAHLLLSRAAARTHEIGVRLALGAGRVRLVRQLLTESLVLSAVGGALALGFAHWGSRALVALAGRPIAVSAGWPAVGFTAAVAIGATCLFGIAPAVAGTRVDVHTALQSRLHGAEGGRRRMLGKSLVVIQVALSLLMVSTAGLLARTLGNLRGQDFGFEPDKVLKAELPLEIGRDTMRRAIAIRDPLYERLNALPGVRVAALSSCGPLSSLQHTSPFSTAGRPVQPSDGSRFVHVSPGYFRTMAPIVAGRGITAEDRKDAPPVAVLSETAARRLFGGENPLGKSISSAKQFDERHSMLVVGVAHDVHFTPRDPYGFIVYVPLAQQPAPVTEVLVRASGDPRRLAGAVRGVIQSVDPHVRIGGIGLLRDDIEAGLAQERMMAWLSGCFGALALLLTFVGIYGVIGYAVERRTREIGIRLALGARRAQIGLLVVKDIGALLAAGVVLGGGASLAAGRALGTLLFGIGSINGMLAGAVLTIAVVALAAAGLPARRAARLDPTAALRLE